MSSYIRNTKNPKTGKFEPAYWIDDYFGHHKYGVKFQDGKVYDPDKVELETNDEPHNASWDSWSSDNQGITPDYALQSRTFRGDGVELTPPNTELPNPYSTGDADEQNNWRSKVFMPITAHYENPKMPLEQKVVIFASQIAPVPKTANEHDKLNKEVLRFSEVLRQEVLKARGMGGKVCACELAEPCMSQCTCANQVMSGGCLRCATYGNFQQRQNAAQNIAELSQELNGETDATTK